MFIRKSKYKAMQNEILRLTNVNEAWELQNKSDLAELRKVQQECSELRRINAELSAHNRELKSALHRASHSSHGGHRHGN